MTVMRAKAYGKVKDVWKDNGNGWCLRQSVEGRGRYLTIVYTNLPRKPRHKVGVPISRGARI